jgi:hypothetical protein
VTFEIEQVERHVDQPVRVVRCKMCWRRLLLKSALRIVKLLDGETVLRHACALGMEGNLSKRRDAPYRSGRQETWIKLKSTPSRSSLLSKSWAHAPIQRAGAAASFKAIVAVPFLNKPPFRSHR